MSEQIYVGNARADGTESRGWVLGHFQQPGDARHSQDVEVKWAIHPAGEKRSEWVSGETRTASVFLISGRFRIHLPGRSVLLSEQGDYVVFHRVPHSWEAELDSVVLIVRWPSLPGYGTAGERAVLTREDPKPPEDPFHQQR